MKKVYYNKLVRDNIVDKINKLGEAFEVRELSDDEFQQELLKKVIEEASALARVSTKEDFLDELADLSIVLDTLTKLQNISNTEVEEARQKNFNRKGGFQKKLFMHWSEDKTYKSNETPQGIKK